MTTVESTLTAVIALLEDTSSAKPDWLYSLLTLRRLEIFTPTKESL